MKTLYTANASSIAGRGGHVETSDQKLKFDLTAPGSTGSGTNPEQLFACGYSACFGGAVMAVGGKEGVKPEEVKINAEVKLNQDDQSGFFLTVKLDALLKGVDAAQATAIVAKAHQVCPYSKATRGNIEVVITANGQPLDATKAAA